MFHSPVINPWRVNSFSRSEDLSIDLSSDSDSLSEDSESETCVAHLKGFGTNGWTWGCICIHYACMDDMHWYMIWILYIYRNREHTQYDLGHGFGAKFSKGKEVSCYFWTTTLSNTILETDMNSKLSVKGNKPWIFGEVHVTTGKVGVATSATCNVKLTCDTRKAT